MKYILAIVTAVVISGCTTSKKSVDERQRLPNDEQSSSASSLPHIDKSALNFYQGPFQVQVAEPVQRTPAKVYLPLQYEERESWPLVVLLHGLGGTADLEDNYLTLRFRTSLKGFILLTPDGTKIVGAADPKYDGRQFWNATDYCCDFARSGVNDVEYLTKLIESVKSQYRVDTKRIYLFGHSNGGFMANRMACEQPQLFAGIASLAGGAFKDVAKCSKSDPISYLQIHAENDPTVFYGPVPLYAGGVETVNQWVSRNGCTTSTTGRSQDFVLQVPDRDTSPKKWASCKNKTEVAFWTIRSHTAEKYESHVPLFNLTFTDAVLDFLFAQSK